MSLQFIQPQSTGLSGLGGNAGVLLQAVTNAKNSTRVYRCSLADSVSPAGETTLWKTLTAGMCQPAVEILNM